MNDIDKGRRVLEYASTIRTKTLDLHNRLATAHEWNDTKYVEVTLPPNCSGIRETITSLLKAVCRIEGDIAPTGERADQSVSLVIRNHSSALMDLSLKLGGEGGAIIYFFQKQYEDDMCTKTLWRDVLQDIESITDAIFTIIQIGYPSGYINSIS